MSLLTSPAMAVELQVTVGDGPDAVPDAVVSLQGPPAKAGATRAIAVMDQRNSTFVPGVLAIQAGTRVSFPNSDQVRHQVYSFSPVRPFELPLYAGTPAAPVLFDRPGVAVVGCNIHDWMIGHIVVLDTPYFEKTDAKGQVRISAPPGDYRLSVWHSRLNGEPLELAVSLMSGQSLQRDVQVTLLPPPPIRQGSDRLRALQEKFRSQKPSQ